MPHLGAHPVSLLVLEHLTQFMVQVRILRVLCCRCQHVFCGDTARIFMLKDLWRPLCPQKRLLHISATVIATLLPDRAYTAS